MTTSTPYATARLAREARVRMRRLRRGGWVAEELVRTAVLVAALATLAVALNGALRSGSAEVAARLDAANQASSVH